MKITISYKSLFKLSSIITIFCLTISCKNNPEKDSANLFLDENASVNSTVGFDFLPTSTTKNIVKHKNYTLSYSEKHEQAEWVAYDLKTENLDNHHYERPYFIKDELVSSGSADWKNYKKSGFDKGHLCPAGDMSFSEESYNETFLTSNISPQTHVFNAGIWNTLEQKVRYWAQKLDGLYVVTGPVLIEGLQTIGKENVAVPTYFYKVLMTKKEGQTKMIAFLVPTKIDDTPLYKHVISVDELEKKTGIDFFPKLNDKIELELEKSSDYKSWSF